MSGLTANKNQGPSATNRQNNKHRCLCELTEQTSSSFMHWYSAVEALIETAGLKRVRVSFRHRRGKSFNDRSGLSGLCSCTVVISRALRAVKITNAPLLESRSIIAPDHISRALQPVSHHFLLLIYGYKAHGVLAYSHTHTKPMRLKLFLT